jgi:hypothetical protein
VNADVINRENEVWVHWWKEKKEESEKSVAECKQTLKRGEFLAREPNPLILKRLNKIRKRDKPATSNKVMFYRSTKIGTPHDGNGNALGR